MLYWKNLRWCNMDTRFRSPPTNPPLTFSFFLLYFEGMNIQLWDVMGRGIVILKSPFFLISPPTYILELTQMAKDGRNKPTLRFHYKYSFILTSPLWMTLKITLGNASHVLCNLIPWGHVSQNRSAVHFVSIGNFSLSFFLFFSCPCLNPDETNLHCQA